MKPDDPVELIFVINNNLVFSNRMKRIDANGLIGGWIDYRNELNRSNLFKRIITRIRRIFTLNTIAINQGQTPAETFVMWAVGYEYVMGIYMRDCVPTPQERLIASHEKMVDTITRESKRGEEWRDDEDNCD